MQQWGGNIFPFAENIFPLLNNLVISQGGALKLGYNFEVLCGARESICSVHVLLLEVHDRAAKRISATPTTNLPAFFVDPCLHYRSKP